MRILENLDIIEQIEGVSLLAPEVVATIEPCDGGIMVIKKRLPVAVASFLSKDAFEQEITILLNLARFELDCVLPLLGNPYALESGDIVFEQRFFNDQLSQVSLYHRRANGFAIFRAILKALALLEDKGFSLSVFSVDSFSFCNFNQIYFLDLSSCRKEVNGKIGKATINSLSALLVDLFLRDNNFSIEQNQKEIEKICALSPLKKMQCHWAIPPGARRVIRELNKRPAPPTVRNLLDWVEKKYHTQDSLKDWEVRVAKGVGKKRLGKSRLAQLPIREGLIGLLIIASFFTLGGIAAELEMQRTQRLKREAALSFVGVSLSAPTDTDLIAEVPPEAVKPGGELTRAEKATIDYRLWVQRECRGCNLAGAEFIGEDLSKVDLTGANLTGAVFRGSKLDKTILTKATLDGALFENVELYRSNLSHALVKGTKFSQVYFNQTTVSHVNFNLIDTSQNHEWSEGADNDSALEPGEIVFSGVDFSYSVLNGQRWSRSGLDLESDRGEGRREHNFQGASLVNFSFRAGDLRGSTFRGANLTGADLSGCDLQGVDFSGARMIGANLEYTNLQDSLLAEINAKGANLFRANLTDALAVGANFESATLNGAFADRTDFTGANFFDASLRNLKGEELSIVTGANFDKADTGWSDFPEP